jgi:hypothetical protein
VGRLLRPIDGVFRRAIGQRAPDGVPYQRDPTRCGYLGGEGCILPCGTRPIVCSAFYCQDFITDLSRDGAWSGIREGLAQISRAVRQLEFRYNIHHRFLSPPTVSIVDSSIGYLWDKLAGLYSSNGSVVSGGSPAVAEGDSPVPNRLW